MVVGDAGYLKVLEVWVVGRGGCRGRGMLRGAVLRHRNLGMIVVFDSFWRRMVGFMDAVEGGRDGMVV